MPIYWFLAGAVTALTALAVLSPRLRHLPRWNALASLSWQARAASATAALAFLACAHWFGGTAEPARLAASPAVAPPASTAPSAATQTPFGIAARAMSGVAAGSAPGSVAETPGTAAGSMDTAIANLESRLAKGGGSDGDWELLAKSFEFLGRPSDAVNARAHHLPPADPGAPAEASAPLRGEITLAAGLAGKTTAGQTLFLVAKSVDSPGMPVAVRRFSVGEWPLRFTLDDSHSMTAGRTLSTAGRVTIEARISRTGQPLPAPGDLQGSTGIVDPADHGLLRIVIDHVIS